MSRYNSQLFPRQKPSKYIFLLLLLLLFQHTSDGYFFPWEKIKKCKLTTPRVQLQRQSNRPERVNYNFPNPKYNGEDKKKPVCPSSDFSTSGGKRWTVNMESIETTGRGEFDLQTLKQITHKSERKRNDIKTPIRRLLPRKREIFRTRYYGKPGLPSNIFDIVKHWNREFPHKAIEEKEFKCDMIYCFSNGTVAFVEENAPPYDGKYGPYLDEEEQKEPRFIVQAARGYISSNNIKAGQEFEAVNKQNREEIFDNFFCEPKNFRHPLLLPNGRYIQ